MSDIDQGGYVYPQVTHEYGEEVHHKGITLRDHFAGIAMNGLLSGQYSENAFLNLWEMPREAYKIADSMIEAGKQ